MGVSASIYIIILFYCSRAMIFLVGWSLSLYFRWLLTYLCSISRSWIVTLRQGDLWRMITARREPTLELVQPSIHGDYLHLDGPGLDTLILPKQPQEGATVGQTKYPVQLTTVKHEIFAADFHNFAICNFREIDNLLYGLFTCS